jgi:hypothetical protein
MAQVISHQPLTAEARVRVRATPCGICGGQIGTETGFSLKTSVFPCQFHSTGAPLHGKTKKLITFITRLHNKHQGCGASVASAAEPFTKKKYWLETEKNNGKPQDNWSTGNLKTGISQIRCSNQFTTSSVQTDRQTDRYLSTRVQTDRQVPIYQTTQRHISQSSNLNSHGRENPNCHKASRVLLQCSQGWT